MQPATSAAPDALQLPLCPITRSERHSADHRCFTLSLNSACSLHRQLNRIN